MSCGTSPSILPIFSKMSQSNAHRQLVLATSRAIQRCNPNVTILTDLQEAPGDPVPPLIGGYRPDIIARSAGEFSSVIVAEAKTDVDLSNGHTLAQIAAFVDYLDAMPFRAGIFVLAVNGRAADLGRDVLRFACRERVSPKLRVTLFDGLDFWELRPLGEPQWRLS